MAEILINVKVYVTLTFELLTPKSIPLNVYNNQMKVKDCYTVGQRVLKLSSGNQLANGRKDKRPGP